MIEVKCRSIPFSALQAPLNLHLQLDGCMLYDLARTLAFRRASTPNTFIGTGCFNAKKIDERTAIKFKPDTLGKVSGKMWINHFQHFAVNCPFGYQCHCQMLHSLLLPMSNLKLKLSNYSFSKKRSFCERPISRCSSSQILCTFCAPIAPRGAKKKEIALWCRLTRRRSEGPSYLNLTHLAVKWVK